MYALTFVYSRVRRSNRTCFASVRLLHHSKFFEGPILVHCLLTFLIVITSFFAYSFFYRQPSLFELRKQKESRAINKQQEED